MCFIIKYSFLLLFFRKEILIVYFIYSNIHEQFLTTFNAVMKVNSLYFDTL